MSQNIRILVIEDEKNIQNFITSVLNSQHYQVISSLTGRDGLSQQEHSLRLNREC